MTETMIDALLQTARTQAERTVLAPMAPSATPAGGPEFRERHGQGGRASTPARAPKRMSSASRCPCCAGLPADGS